MHQHRDNENANENEIGLSPIIDSLPPNPDKKSLREELEEVAVSDAHGDREEEGTGAPLSKSPSRVSVFTSKARLIGLVLTLTGASFLNVSQVRSHVLFSRICIFSFSITYLIHLTLSTLQTSDQLT